MTSELFDVAATRDPLRFTWKPSPLLCIPSGSLQGGAGLGGALAAMEAATGRPVIWATAQFLSFAMGTDAIDLDVTIQVSGHNTTQARCSVSRGDVEILGAQAALGSRDLDVEGVWCAPPPVPHPEDCPPYGFFGAGRGDLGDLVEMRLAHGRQPQSIELDGGRGDGTFALWVRCWEGDHAVTVPDLVFIGDFMPLAFAQALGAPFFGNSLDNTVRVGQLTTTPWVLLAAHAQQVANGFGYGRAELWAQDGTLLGEVSQTSVMRLRAPGRARSGASAT